ncbi:MYXO-CTERM sorting domain-containing protein [Corallococcus sp. EGB]
MPKNDPPEESGCGCTTSPGAAGTSFLLLLTLTGVLRRRTRKKAQ